MSQGRRLHERFDIELPVTVLYNGAEIPGSTVNVSLGGMLVRVERPVPFGADVTLRIELPALRGEPTDIAAVVRWDRDGQIGVQFRALRAKETWAINQLTKPR